MPALNLADELLQEINIGDSQLDRLRTLNDPISRAMRDEVAGRRGTLERPLPLRTVTPVAQRFTLT